MNGLTRPWQGNNEGLRSSNPIPSNVGGSRNVPILPPRPTVLTNLPCNINSPMYQNPYSGYGGYGYGGTSYNSFGYRNPMYGSTYGSYGSYGYGNNGFYNSGFGPGLDAESRFIQFAEERSRNTFASVESIVRAVNSISMMLDNTFFAMTSSFRAVLSVAENFGHLRNMFSQIWYSLSLFRLFRWFYKRLMNLLGYKVISNGAAKLAWNEAAGRAPNTMPNNWPTVAFFGLLISAPYFISKFLLPQYEDKHNPEKWKTPGIKAKVAFDFIASSPNELSVRVNDELLLAPIYIQEEMKLANTGWAFAVGNGKSGLIPLNYLLVSKTLSNGVLKNKSNINNNFIHDEVPIIEKKSNLKSNVKRVSFGENQIIESNGTERIVKIPEADTIETQSTNDLPIFDNTHCDNLENDDNLLTKS